MAGGGSSSCHMQLAETQIVRDIALLRYLPEGPVLSDGAAYFGGVCLAGQH